MGLNNLVFAIRPAIQTRLNKGLGLWLVTIRILFARNCKSSKASKGTGPPNNASATNCEDFGPSVSEKLLWPLLASKKLVEIRVHGSRNLFGIWENRRVAAILENRFCAGIRENADMPQKIVLEDRDQVTPINTVFVMRAPPVQRPHLIVAIAKTETRIRRRPKRPSPFALKALI